MKKSFGVFAGAALAVALTLVGCQTAKPIAPAQSVIRVEEPGFAPQGNAEHSSIEMALLFGNGESIKSWTVSIMANGLTLKSLTGTAATMPANSSAARSCRPRAKYARPRPSQIEYLPGARRLARSKSMAAWPGCRWRKNQQPLRKSS